MNELNPAYDPLHYALLFPRGEPGWRIRIPINGDPDQDIPSQRVDRQANGRRHRRDPRPLADEHMVRCCC